MRQYGKKWEMYSRSSSTGPLSPFVLIALRSVKIKKRLENTVCFLFCANFVPSISHPYNI
jgi:hypothetical protein